jgi:hypothetical protein
MGESEEERHTLQSAVQATYSYPTTDARAPRGFLSASPYRHKNGPRIGGLMISFLNQAYRLSNPAPEPCSPGKNERMKSEGGTHDDQPDDILETSLLKTTK